VLDVGWWISLFAYKPLPSARRSRERKKKDRASYRHYDLHPRICVQETEWERTNKRRKLTSCYHPIRKGAGVAPANNAQAINIFCFVVFFFVFGGVLQQICISVDATPELCKALCLYRPLGFSYTVGKKRKQLHENNSDANPPILTSIFILPPIKRKLMDLYNSYTCRKKEIWKTSLGNRSLCAVCWRHNIFNSIKRWIVCQTAVEPPPPPPQKKK
jgi:hypothetical protein